MIRAYFTQHYVVILAGLVLTALCLWSLLSTQPGVRAAVDRLEYLGYDLRLQATLPELAQEDLDVVIIDIDEKSLEEQGRWPISASTAVAGAWQMCWSSDLRAQQGL